MTITVLAWEHLSTPKRSSPFLVTLTNTRRMAKVRVRKHSYAYSTALLIHRFVLVADQGRLKVGCRMRCLVATTAIE